MIPHKKFIATLVRPRQRIALPIELDLSFGMRRYKMLLTEERGTFPVFHRERGRYMLPESLVEERHRDGSSSL